MVCLGGDRLPDLLVSRDTLLLVAMALVEAARLDACGRTQSSIEEFFGSGRGLSEVVCCNVSTAFCCGGPMAGLFLPVKGAKPSSWWPLSTPVLEDEREPRPLAAGGGGNEAVHEALGESLMLIMESGRGREDPTR